jgi:CubicO group peptidase (beta-lactamase class C family)
MVDISGRCKPGFEAVKDAFALNFDQNDDVGASCAVTLHGELIVDLWGGTLDVGGTTPWEEDTIINVFSTTKTMSCLSLLVLASRGLVDVDAPVARYWPEFEQNGKEGVLVRHLLSHTAGVPAWDRRLDVTDLYDWDKVTALLAEQAPWWEPGWKSGYHAITQGNLVGEVVRRVDGRSPGRFFAEEIAAPWALDFHIGLGPAEQARAARLVDPHGAWRQSVRDDPRRWLQASLDNPPGMLDVDVVNSAAYRAAEIPAVNGHGTARAIARFYGGLAAGGELDGVRLLRPETLDEAFRPQASGRDQLLEDEAVWSLGFRVDDGESFGLGGIGGFSGYGLRRPGIALGYGYVSCLLAGYDRTEACEDALEEALS